MARSILCGTPNEKSRIFQRRRDAATLQSEEQQGLAGKRQRHDRLRPKDGAANLKMRNEKVLYMDALGCDPFF